MPQLYLSQPCHVTVRFKHTVALLLFINCNTVTEATLSLKAAKCIRRNRVTWHTPFNSRENAYRVVLFFQKLAWKFQTEACKETGVQPVLLDFRSSNLAVHARIALIQNLIETVLTTDITVNVSRQLKDVSGFKLSLFDLSVRSHLRHFTLNRCIA